MSQILPLRGLRPRDDLAGRIICPPYDVIDEGEARQIAAADPISFVHVDRGEVNLPPGTDIHSEAAYQAAKTQLDRFVREGLLVRDATPCIYLYGQKMPLPDENGLPTNEYQEQVGFLANMSVAEYDRADIRKHEHTRPDKVEDRTLHIETLNAQVGLVFLAYREDPEVTAVLDRHAARPPAWSVTSDDGVVHTLWVISEPAAIAEIQAAFSRLPRLYVADGHHRSQSASRYHEKHPDNVEGRGFLAGVFPHSRLRIMAYNRLVVDLNNRSADQFLAEVAERFTVTTDVPPQPSEGGQYTMYLEGRWYGLKALPALIPSDPVGGLDVSVLQDQLLRPILGIQDPRTDKRVHFVGGIRGWKSLQASVDGGEAAVAFHLYPTQMDQLLSVADALEVMPPKSTWFEPKLRSGVVIHTM